MNGGDNCTVATSGGNINQTVAAPVTSLTPSTAVSQVTGTGAVLTVNAGAGIVNADASAIDASIATVNNSGIIATTGNATNGQTTVTLGGAATVNNGTTSSGAVIGAYGSTHNSAAIFAQGDLTLNQGSATTSGTIVNRSSDGDAIYANGGAANVTIQNTQGTISGGSHALELGNGGAISIVNGDGTRAAAINSTNTTGDSHAIWIDESNSSAVSITNNANASISVASPDAKAIYISDSNLGSGPHAVINHGTITGGSGSNGAAIDLTGNVSANHVTVTNDGTITGKVKVGAGDTINNQGSITAGASNAPVVFAAGNADTTINNGTTVTGALIGNQANTGVGVMVGGFNGNLVTGGLSLTQGSATTSGAIYSSSAGGAGVYVGRTSGNVTINNIQGTIQGETALDLTTSQQITVTNGDGTRVGRIIGTGSDAAFLIGTNNQNENLSPTFAVTNNLGSIIRATVAGQNAIEVDHAIGGASSIVNHGVIAAGSGGAAIDLTGNTSGANHVTVTNDGMIAGDIKLGAADTLNVNGGVITGDITGQTSGSSVNIGGNAAVNGNIGSSNIYVPVLFSGDHTLTMGSGKSILGDVRAGTNGQGTVSFSGSTNIYGDMGQSGAGLKAVDINGGTADLDTGNYYVGITTVNSGATLKPCAANACDSGDTYHGNLVLNGGVLDLRNSGGTSTLAAGPNGSTGTFTTTSGSTIRTLITGDGNTSGAGSTNLTRIVAAGAVSLGNGTTVTPDITSYSAISNGARYILASGGSAATVGTVSATNTGLYNWSVLRGDAVSLGQNANDVYLVADRVTLANATRAIAGNSGSASAVAAVMDGFANSNDSRAQAVNTQLASLANSSPAALQSALKKMAPDVSGAATQGSVSAANAVSNVVSAHTDTVRVASAGGQTGVATGDSLRGIGLWLQPFGFHGVQDERQGVSGFTANSSGLAFGGDVAVIDPLRVGLALSFGKTWVSGRQDATGNKTDLDSYQATLYATYQGKPWYADVQLGYGYNQYDATRLVTVGAISEAAKGKFDGTQMTAKVDAGYPIALGKTVVTPNASLTYALLHQAGYTETNAPNLGLAVEESNDHTLRSGLGVNASRTFDISGGGTLTPMVKVGWLHDFRSNAPVTTAQFAFGGSSFTTSGATPARNSAVLGAGLTFVNQDQYSLSGEYDAEIKAGYVAHTGLLKARVDF